MKSLKELRENIKSTKELILNSNTEGLVQHINDSRIVYRENEYWLVDFKINSTVVIYVFQDGRIIISYNYISSDYIEDSMRLYDYIESLKDSIKDIFFSIKKDFWDNLKQELLDLTGYSFELDFIQTNYIRVNDGYFAFQCSNDEFVMIPLRSTYIVFDVIENDKYDLFKRLDTYKETHKYIKELLGCYIKEL